MNTQRGTQTKHFRSNGNRNRNNNGSNELGQNTATQDAATGEKGSVIEAAQDGAPALRDNYKASLDEDAKEKSGTITISEAARVLGCSRDTVARAIREGRFPALHIGTSVRIPRKAFERMLETGELYPQVTEVRVYVDERSAQKVADLITKKMLEMEQERLASQLQKIGGSVRI